MRNGAGYTRDEQRRREQVRLLAAERFARGDEISEIADDLRVTEGSVRRRDRAWRDGGTEALRSKGPLAYGFAHDQRWTLGRARTLTGRLCHVGYTVEGTSELLRRHGWPAQVPVRQAPGTR
jgi:putative transposase